MVLSKGLNLLHMFVSTSMDFKAVVTRTDTKTYLNNKKLSTDLIRMTSRNSNLINKPVIILTALHE